jgi:ribonuclease G
MPSLQEAMQQDILINWTPHETRVAVVEGGALQEVHIERALERGLVGNVYLGRVARVLPGMQSAFIDIGLERAAFLHVADLLSTLNARHAEVDSPTNALVLPIEKQVFEGQTLLVQVIKDPIGTKGARLSTQISIAGRFLVYLPQDQHIGVSQKIPQETREALKKRLTDLAVAAFAPQPTGGFILRTNAEDASDQELSDDLVYLRKTWVRIHEQSTKLPPMSKLHQDLSLLQRVLRDMVSDITQSIRIDSKEQFNALRSFGEAFMPASVSRLQHYTGERPIFDLFGIEDDLGKALGRRVDLKSGGYLMIDQTEALTTVDVNTGGFVGAKNFEDTIFKTNLEAAGAIARQLRLRNLGGIVIADFIDMSSLEHQQAILQEFAKHLQRDRVKTMVSGFSSLGLVEMTRKRTRDSLAHLLCEPCEACQGKGFVKTARTLAYSILREILREARQFNPKEFRVLAPQGVIDMLLDEEREHVASLSEFIGKPISLQVDPALGQEQFDIILV